MVRCISSESLAICKLSNHSHLNYHTSETCMLGQLTPDEIRFLNQHKIPLSQVFDLSGRTVAECHDAMVEEEKLFGFNASSCGAGLGHRLVTRTGHCIQCTTRNIAEIRRHHGKGDVYLAGSLSQSMIKIGSSANADKRVPALIAQAYGGATDWRKLQVVRSISNVGKLEFEIQTELEEFRVGDVYYSKDGKQLKCNELFTCALQTAVEAFSACLPKLTKASSVLPSELAQYVFPDRVTVKHYRIGNRR